MEYLQEWNIFKKQNKVKNKPKETSFTKSNFEVKKKNRSYIDSNKELTIAIKLKCPRCSYEMNDMDHWEIQKCPSCKTLYQCFGNALVADKVDWQLDSRSDKKHDYELDTQIITNDIVKERLRYSDYVDKYQNFDCPLCGENLPFFKKASICPTCKMQMSRDGDYILCTAPKDTVDFYREIDKFNL